MNETCETIGPMLSGYLDGELDATEREHVDRHLRECAACRAALEDERAVIGVADELQVPAVDDDVWDAFLGNVYNRLERRLGWLLFFTGIAMLSCVVLYWAVVMPWAPPVMKVVFATPFAGLGVLFVSVLRQRMYVAKTDRYSRDIKR